MTTQRDTLNTLRAELAKTISRQLRIEGASSGLVPGLQLHRHHTTTAGACKVYETLFVAVVQGAKAINLGNEMIFVDQLTWMLTPIEVPAISRITKASNNKPYLSCSIPFNIQAAREMITVVEPSPCIGRARGPALITGPMTTQLLDALIRMIRLNESPSDVPILGPLMQREVLYRLLSSGYTGVMREILTADSQGQKVARAVEWLRMNYREPLFMEDLARQAHMAVSTLHHRFREMTGSSPLQFQKQLRLFEARRLMLVDGMDAASSAFATGYESATQFNREYRRQFGQPPRKDVIELQEIQARALSGPYKRSRQGISRTGLTQEVPGR